MAPSGDGLPPPGGGRAHQAIRGRMGPVKRKMKEGQMKIPSRTLPGASILKKGVREDMRESTTKAQVDLRKTQMIPTEREGRNKMRPTGTLWTEGKARATQKGWVNRTYGSESLVEMDKPRHTGIFSSMRLGFPLVLNANLRIEFLMKL